MEALLAEAQAAFDAGIYMPALISILAVPDAAGAIDYPDLKNNLRFPRWFDEHVSAFTNGRPDGALAWAFRNAVLHETRTNWRTKGFGFDRVVIMPPTPGMIFHANITQANGEDGLTLQLDLRIMIAQISAAARAWLQTARTDPAKAERIDGLMQLRPGVPGHYMGIALIA